MNRLVPETIEEAIALLNDGYLPVGGGTDMIVRRHALLKSDPRAADSDSRSGSRLFSTRKIRGTGGVRTDGGRLIIGSSAKLSEIISFPGCPKLLAESLLSIAAPGIRNAATLAGNICNASPAADSLPALYALNAEITAAGTSGTRDIPISDFITGPGKTALAAGELVVSISCELTGSGYGHIFRKVGTRAANALSKLCIAAIWKEGGAELVDFRLAAGACAPTVIRSADAENFILEKRVKEALHLYSRLLNPIDDQRSTAEYRRNTALKVIEKIIYESGADR